MSNWIKFKDYQRPRRGELIVVKSSCGIYESILIVRGINDFWRYDPLMDTQYLNGDFSGINLSFHGLTHWKLIDSLVEY